MPIHDDPKNRPSLAIPDFKHSIAQQLRNIPIDPPRAEAYTPEYMPKSVIIDFIAKLNNLTSREMPEADILDFANLIESAHIKRSKRRRIVPSATATLQTTYASDRSQSTGRRCHEFSSRCRKRHLRCGTTDLKVKRRLG